MFESKNSLKIRTLLSLTLKKLCSYKKYSCRPCLSHSVSLFLCFHFFPDAHDHNGRRRKKRRLAITGTIRFLTSAVSSFGLLLLFFVLLFSLLSYYPRWFSFLRLKFAALIFWTEKKNISLWTRTSFALFFFLSYSFLRLKSQQHLVFRPQEKSSTLIFRTKKKYLSVCFFSNRQTRTYAVFSVGAGFYKEARKMNTSNGPDDVMSFEQLVKEGAYDILEVHRNASEQEVISAFKKKVKRVHPDKQDESVSKAEKEKRENEFKQYLCAKR